jgi:hypothetical protein
MMLGNIGAPGKTARDLIWRPTDAHTSAKEVRETEPVSPVSEMS